MIELNYIKEMIIIKIYKLVVPFFLIIFFIGCDRSNKVADISKFIDMNLKISNKKDFQTEINKFIDENKDKYTIITDETEADNAYGIFYDIYDKGVSSTRYSDDPLASISVYFENDSDEGLVVDLLYSFPLVEDESEKNLKMEYELYIILIDALLLNDNDNLNVIDFFEMNSFDDYMKIYNIENKYNFRNINLNDDGDYINTMFVDYNKSMILEYRDSSFIEESF